MRHSSSVSTPCFTLPERRRTHLFLELCMHVLEPLLTSAVADDTGAGIPTPAPHAGIRGFALLAAATGWVEGSENTCMSANTYLDGERSIKTSRLTYWLLKALTPHHGTWSVFCSPLQSDYEPHLHECDRSFCDASVHRAAPKNNVCELVQSTDAAHVRRTWSA